VLDGSGAAGQPTGIMNTAGISSVTMLDIAGAASGIGSPPAIAAMLEFVSDLDGANAPTGSRGWAIHPLFVSEIRQMQVDYGNPSTPLTAVNTSEGFNEFVLGFKFRQTSQMTAPTVVPASTKSVLFGNWDDVMIARWGGLRLLASDTSDDAFSKDQTHIRATMRCDVALRHPESFSYSL
jgi:HK97 family phage major capsid protein